jgi:hypothetical protein
MKKVLHGLMAAALSLGLAASPAFAGAVSPRVDGVSNIEQVATKKKNKSVKKATKKKTQTAKKKTKKSAA